MNRSGKTAMSLHSLLQSIADAPGDVSRRLVYADWLEERGNSLCHEWRKPLVRTRLAEDTEIFMSNGDGTGIGIWRYIRCNETGDGGGDGFTGGYGDSLGGGEGQGFCFDPWIPYSDGYGAGDHNQDVNGRGDGQHIGHSPGFPKAVTMTGATFF